MREADFGATGLTGDDLNGRFTVPQTSGTDPFRPFGNLPESGQPSLTPNTWAEFGVVRERVATHGLKRLAPAPYGARTCSVGK